MRYTVEPGLYAVGEPDEGAPVLVTANYKLSFDAVRSALEGRSAWILVLDTLGVNVWCAAGKGTFGTEELVRRIGDVDLAEVVKHREVIVPQLGAPSVAGFHVRKASGFKVIWGPIRSRDLPAFLDAGLHADPGMRRKTFELRERVTLIPVELVGALKPVAVIVGVVLLAGGLGTGVGFLAGLSSRGVTGALAVLGGVLAGAVLTPILLPWLPGRAFALKGLWVGLAVAGAVAAARGSFASPSVTLETAAWLVIGVVLATFLAMNFTGASTYTSLSGVKREMRVAVPLQIGGAAVGLALLVAGRLMG